MKKNLLFSMFFIILLACSKDDENSGTGADYKYPFEVLISNANDSIRDNENVKFKVLPQFLELEKNDIKYKFVYNSSNPDKTVLRYNGAIVNVNDTINYSSNDFDVLFKESGKYDLTFDFINEFKYRATSVEIFNVEKSTAKLNFEHKTFTDWQGKIIEIPFNLDTQLTGAQFKISTDKEVYFNDEATLLLPNVKKEIANNFKILLKSDIEKEDTFKITLENNLNSDKQEYIINYKFNKYNLTIDSYILNEQNEQIQNVINQTEQAFIKVDYTTEQENPIIQMKVKPINQSVSSIQDIPLDSYINHINEKKKLNLISSFSGLEKFIVEVKDGFNNTASKEVYLNVNEMLTYPFSVILNAPNEARNNTSFNISLSPSLAGEQQNPNPQYQFQITATDAEVKNGNTILTQNSWLNYSDLTNGSLSLKYATQQVGAKVISVKMKNSQGHEAIQTKNVLVQANSLTVNGGSNNLSVIQGGTLDIPLNIVSNYPTGTTYEIKTNSNTPFVYLNNTNTLLSNNNYTTLSNNSFVIKVLSNQAGSFPIQLQIKNSVDQNIVNHNLNVVVNGATLTVTGESNNLSVIQGETLDIPLQLLSTFPTGTTYQVKLVSSNINTYLNDMNNQLNTNNFVSVGTNFVIKTNSNQVGNYPIQLQFKNSLDNTTYNYNFNVSVTQRQIDFNYSLKATGLGLGNEVVLQNNIVPFVNRNNSFLQLTNLHSNNQIVSMTINSSAIESINGVPLVNNSVTVPYGLGKFDILYKTNSYGLSNISLTGTDAYGNEMGKSFQVDLKYKLFDVSFTWGTGLSSTNNTSSVIDIFANGHWQTPYRFVFNGRNDKFIKIHINGYDPNETYTLQVQNSNNIIRWTNPNMVEGDLQTDWTGNVVLQNGVNYVRIDNNITTQAAHNWGTAPVTFKVINNNGEQKTKTYTVNVYLNGSLN